MNPVALMDSSDKVIRTQVTLTQRLRGLVEERANDTGRSLSEYLRQAALLLMLVEDKKADDLTLLARKIIGSVKLINHPQWRSKAAIISWQRKLRSEWPN